MQSLWGVWNISLIPFFLGVMRWQTCGDVECVAWNPAKPTQFMVSTEDGSLTCYDTTVSGKVSFVFSFLPHKTN